MANSRLASAAIFTTSAAVTVGLLHSWDIGLFGYGIVTTIRNLHDEENIRKLNSNQEDFLPSWGKETLCPIFNKKMNEGWRVNSEAVEAGYYRDMLGAIQNVCQKTEELENKKEELKNIILGIKDMQDEEEPEDDDGNSKFTFPRTSSTTNTNSN